MTVSTIAVLGTGIMGRPMAANLLAHGFRVRAWNRTSAKARPLAEQGAEVCATPREAATGADAVLTMLAEGDVVEQVMSGPDGVLSLDRPPPLWVQASTVGVDATSRLVELAESAALTFVDAPVLGTKQPAEQGKLVVLAAGADSALAECAPIFDAIGGRTLLVGEAGAASRLKLVVNAWVLAVTAATAQSVALAQALDLDPNLFLDSIEGGALDVPYAHVKGAAMIEGEYPPSFPVTLAAKDAQLVLDAGERTGVDLAVTRAALHQLARAVELGHQDADMAALFAAVRP